METLYTAEELAAILKIRVETVRQKTREGEFKCHVIANRKRYLLSEVAPEIYKASKANEH